MYDELAHLLKQQAAMQTGDFRPLVWGHISSYDPATSRVKAIIPSLRDGDTSPTETGWMPLMSASVGAGFGLQIAPFGGATLESPTAGEQCLVGLFGGLRGVASTTAVCLGMTFNAPNQPPDEELSPPLQPGEVVLRQKSGTFIRLSANGDLEVVSTNDVNVTVQGTVVANVTGDATVTVEGDATITATGQANLLSAAQVNLGAIGGRKVARDGDPVSTGGHVNATSTTVFSA